METGFILKLNVVILSRFLFNIWLISGMTFKKTLYYLGLYLCMVSFFHFGTSLASDQNITVGGPVTIVDLHHESEEMGVDDPKVIERAANEVRVVDHDTAPEQAAGYKLGAGDVLKISVYGEDELSDQYKVSDKGYISMPLVGDVLVRDLTAQQVSLRIQNLLSDGYIKDPDVAIEVSEFRPFYIMGEVRNPGSYAYVADMTILNAVVLAGGYTYRANKDKHEVMREEEGISQVFKEEPDSTKVQPGDVILVKERFF